MLSLVSLHKFLSLANDQRRITFPWENKEGGKRQFKHKSVTLSFLIQGSHGNTHYFKRGVNDAGHDPFKP